MDDGALDDALEAGGRLGVLAVLDDERGRARSSMIFGDAPLRSASMSTSQALHHRPRRRDRRSAPAAGARASRTRGALVGVGPSRDAGPFRVCGERGHGRPIPFPSCIAADAGSGGRSPYLRDLGLGHFVGVDAADPDALVWTCSMMRMASSRALLKTLQHVHDELHRRVVVVQQQHPVEAGLLVLGLVLVMSPVLPSSSPREPFLPAIPSIPDAQSLPQDLRRTALSRCKSFSLF